MVLQLSNSIFCVHFDANQGSFDVSTVDPELPDLYQARINLAYRVENRLVKTELNHWQELKKTDESKDLDCQDEVDLVGFQTIPDQYGIACKLHFGIMKEYPLVVWKVEMIHQGSVPVEVVSIDLLDLDPAKGGRIKWSKAVVARDLGFYSNGWQSWSTSRWYPADGKMNVSRLGGLQLPMTQNVGTPLPKAKGQFSSDFFAVLGDRAARNGFLVGSLSQLNQFTSIVADFNSEPRLRMWANGDNARLDPGCSMITDWAAFNPILLDHRDPLNKYLEAVERQNRIRVPSESPTGWCSWYHFYTHISESIIKQNLNTIVEKQEVLPLQLVQIDDGFESQIGDWFTFKPEFPNGVAPLAAEIKREGLLPGLWLAPFILHPKAEVIKEHPDWVLRKANGKPASAGYCWGAITTALDLTVPEALDYACRVVKTASSEWGYPYLKLDFLYAATVDCQYQDPTVTRAQVLRKGMEAIRNAVGPDVTLLGCGAPLGSMLGLVEAMRIGADVSGDWAPKFAGIGAFIKNEPGMPCARNSIRNILTRAFQHQHWWINDPDCLLIRPETRLSLAEVRSLTTAIALTGGSLLVSDDLPKLPKDRLRIAECLLPVLGDRARVIDWFDAEMPAKLRLDQVNETGEWHVLAKFNWSDQPADLTLSATEFHLPEGDYWTSEFWSATVQKVNDGNELRFSQVPAHGCVLTAWRNALRDVPVYLGSDLHISQGVEVAEWKSDGECIQFTLRLPRTTNGQVRLSVPGGVNDIRVNDKQVEVNVGVAGVFTIPVEVDGFARIQLIKA